MNGSIVRTQDISDHRKQCPHLRFRAMKRMARLAGFLSSSIRLSLRNRHSPSQYMAMYFRAYPVRDLAKMRARLRIYSHVQKKSSFTDMQPTKANTIRRRRSSEDLLYVRSILKRIFAGEEVVQGQRVSFLPFSFGLDRGALGHQKANRS